MRDFSDAPAVRVGAQAEHLHEDWVWAFETHQDNGAYRPDPVSAGRRALANLALSHLVLDAQRSGDTVWPGKAFQRVKDAGNFTDRQGALIALLHAHHELAEPALARVHAQFKGEALVIDRAAEPGLIVQPGKALLSLALQGPAELVADVDERFLAELKPGQDAAVLADALPGQPFRATLVRIAPRIDAQRGAVELRGCEVWIILRELGANCSACRIAAIASLLRPCAFSTLPSEKCASAKLGSMRMACSAAPCARCSSITSFLSR